MTGGQNSGKNDKELTASSAMNADISVDLPSNFGAFGSGAGIGDANAILNSKHRMDF
jgi:predicted nicotinamide N-methyase